MEFNGDVYACDHFVEPDYLRGNIHETHLAELVSVKQQLITQIAALNRHYAVLRQVDPRQLTGPFQLESAQVQSYTQRAAGSVDATAHQAALGQVQP
jgi:uncharacterized protein (DUF2461 family)